MTSKKGKRLSSKQKKKGDVYLVMRKPKSTSDADLKELAQAMYQEMVDRGLVKKKHDHEELSGGSGV
jgi:hypothetical protein